MTQSSDSIPKVFISSTSEDLKDYRQAALEAVLSAGCHPVRQEDWAASGRLSLPECLARVDEADVVVAIVAHRYGWVPEDQPGDGQKNITWLECERAWGRPIDVLAFLVDEAADWPRQDTDEYRFKLAAKIADPEERRRERDRIERDIDQLTVFKVELNRYVRATFANRDRLNGAVYHALVEWQKKRDRNRNGGGQAAQSHRRQLFISYSRQDGEAAQKVVAALRKAGHHCWMDTTSIPGGARWLREIQGAIDRCERVIALVSDSFVDSEWVEEELLYARQVGKPAIPCLLHERTLPMLLIAQQPIRLYGEAYSVELQGLLSALANDVARTSLQESAEAASAGGSRAPASNARVAVLLSELDHETTAPPRRAQIGDELAKLGDPRPGIGLKGDGLPDIDWVEIPEGPFIYQWGERVELPPFHMARYPVTNAQFQAFIDDGGYAEDRWWKGLAQRIKAPASPRWSLPNRPRETVSWYEAMAFCHWLSSKLSLDEGRVVRLPTEQEWEKAARGTDGREYPWGEGYRAGFANINETRSDAGPHYLAETSPVGIYPHGASPYGVLDMAGNVWEWCLNEYKKPTELGPDGNAARALRGGSWVNSPVDARAVVRGGLDAVNRDGGVGFRLVCGPSIPR